MYRRLNIYEYEKCKFFQARQQMHRKLHNLHDVFIPIISNGNFLLVKNVEVTSLWRFARPVRVIIEINCINHVDIIDGLLFDKMKKFLMYHVNKRV